MYPLWLKLLEWIGRLRLPLGPRISPVTIGHPSHCDYAGGMEWKDFAGAEALYDVWGPVADSPWVSYHCVPLFAAIDAPAVSQIGPLDPDTAAALERGPHLGACPALEPLGAAWTDSGSWVILDLPGPASVALAIRFLAAGFQPICTFNHWPHPKGLLQPEQVLAQLVRYAPAANRLRKILLPGSPPLWICDRHRLGTRPGLPREFDNRYYLEDALLPSRAQLEAAGIRQVIYVQPGPRDRPLPDIGDHLHQLQKSGFTTIFSTHLEDPELACLPIPPHARSPSFRSSSFQRSAAGGFGRLIPEPSSSGG